MLSTVTQGRPQHAGGGRTSTLTLSEVLALFTSAEVPENLRVRTLINLVMSY